MFIRTGGVLFPHKSGLIIFTALILLEMCATQTKGYGQTSNVVCWGIKTLRITCTPVVGVVRFKFPLS